MALGNSSEGRLNFTLESAAQELAAPKSEASRSSLNRQRRNHPGNLVVSISPLTQVPLSMSTMASLPCVRSHEREIHQKNKRREIPSRPVTTLYPLRVH